jgi:oxygen-dependent protoporphyrinogen oxidase
MRSATGVNSHVPVLVVGAGISGLVCAYSLRKSGIDAQIAEASPRPGGVIHSERRDGFLLELGPQSFSGTAQILELCRDLGVEDELVEAPPRAPRFLLIEGQLKQAPSSPPAFFVSSLFSARTKWSILRDALGSSAPPDADESVAAFTRRKFTAELLDKLVAPFVSGIYAGDPEKLSLRAAFPQIFEAERTAGSITRGMRRAAKSNAGPKQGPTLQSFKNGNETLVQALTASLGPALRCGVEVTSLRREEPEQQWSRFVVDFRSQGGNESLSADHVVLATPSDVAGNLLKTVPGRTETRLCEIESTPVAVVSLGYARASIRHSLGGFGFLVPRSEGQRVLGTVWNSSLFPNRAPDGHVLLTSFLGGATDPQTAVLSPDALVSLVHGELARILSIRQPPVFSNVRVYERGLPQYNLGHPERVHNVSHYGFPCANLWLIGNYLRGPSIGACLEQALSTAAQIYGLGLR